MNFSFLASFQMKSVTALNSRPVVLKTRSMHSNNSPRKGIVSVMECHSRPSHIKGDTEGTEAQDP